MIRVFGFSDDIIILKILTIYHTRFLRSFIHSSRTLAANDPTLLLSQSSWFYIIPTSLFAYFGGQLFMLFLTLPIRVSPQFSSQFHSPLSTKRRRVPSSGIFEWKCFRDCGTFPKSQHGPGIWNTRMKRKMVAYKNYLSTNTLGIWTSCRGLFPSFRAWLRFKILKKNHDTVVNRILLSINQQFLFSSYECKFHLTPHDTHLLFKHQSVKPFVCLKKKNNEVSRWLFKQIS